MLYICIYMYLNCKCTYTDRSTSKNAPDAKNGAHIKFVI